MRALDRARAAAGATDAGLQVVDTVVLLVALALTCLLVAVGLRAAARARVKTADVESSGFSLMKGASWLQTAAIILAIVAAAILLWTLVLRVVQMD